MCNRYVSPAQAEIERHWNIGRRNNNPWRGGGVYPRAPGAFIRSARDGDEGIYELAIGQWGLIPSFAKESKLTYSTNNARAEEVASKASYRDPWKRGQRCIIPASSFDEPCWETGKNVWWTFRRADGVPWGLAGLWNAWTDITTGELIESYTMLTINCDGHPIMGRMHKPDPKLPPDQQDKRSVVVIEAQGLEQWLSGSVDEAQELVRPPSVRVFAE